MDKHALVIVDVSGAIRHWNIGAEELFGYSAASAVGKSLDLIVPEEFRDPHWIGFRRAMETGSAKIDGSTTEFPVSCADGDIKVFSAAVTLLRDARRKVIGAMVICEPEIADA